MKKSYRVYGLDVLADSPIPGLEATSGFSQPPDVTMQISERPDWAERALRLPSECYHQIAAEKDTADPSFQVNSLGTMEFFELVYGDGTRFLVDGAGTRVWGTWKPPLVLEDLATYLLGPVMGFLLRRRGVTPLHASALSIGGRAVALSGAALAGKSTTAAALALRGVSVLCEDIAALKEGPRGFFVEPGYPRVCVWPDAAEKLLGPGETLPRLTPNWEKCFLALDGTRGKFESEPLPLSLIYMLAERSEESNVPRVEKISPHNALVELVQNTYMNWLLDRRQRASEFDLLSRLVECVPVRRIVPHRDPLRLGEICELLLDDVRKVSAASHGSR